MAINEPRAAWAATLNTPRAAVQWWKPAAILALPFLLVVVAFDWLALTFPTFHGDDEVLYHWPIIQRFFTELPWPSVGDYESATAPLFHVAFAAAAHVLGLELQTLRLLNVAVSLAAVLVFHGMVARFLPQREAVLLALLLAVSPYFFGASFLVLTDNFGILLALLALRALAAAWDSGSARHWALFCVFVALAALTRQLYAWLAVGAVFAMFVRREPIARALPKIGALALSGLPLLALVIVWNGLTPPTFQQHHVAAAAITPRAGVFGMAVFGLFWAALFPDRVLAALRDLRAQRYLPLLAILVATVAVLLLVPTTPQESDNGLLWRLSRAMPELGGTRIVFWLLFPLGLLFFWNALRSRETSVASSACLGLAFLLCNLPNAMVFEKYYDPLTIVLVILTEMRVLQAQQPWPAGRAEGTGAGAVLPLLAPWSRTLLLLAFLAYPFVSWKMSGGA